MSRTHHHRRRDRQPGSVHRRHGPIRRVVRGLAARFRIARHYVIGGFVLGLVFAPILTLLLFLVAWVWVEDPVRFERGLSGAVEKARSAYRAFRGSGGRAAGGREPAYAAGPRAREVDFPDLCRRFEDLERRTGRMEGYVTSQEFALDRGFRDIEGKGGRTR